jgi:hypothetical protein
MALLDRSEVYKRRRISCRAVFAPAVFDFALREIKHREQAQRNFGGFVESEFKILRYTVACQARLIKRCARHNTHMVLWVNRILPEQKNGFLRCSACFEYRRSKNLTVCSLGNSLLCRIPNTARATLSGTPSSNKH